jgi:hypothetical protein
VTRSRTRLPASTTQRSSTATAALTRALGCAPASRDPQVRAR